MQRGSTRPEVSTKPASQRRRLALEGAPDAPEVDAHLVEMASMIVENLADLIVLAPESD
jgi:hypothetical protein